MHFGLPLICTLEQVKENTCLQTHSHNQIQSTFFQKGHLCKKRRKEINIQNTFIVILFMNAYHSSYSKQIFFILTPQMFTHIRVIDLAFCHCFFWSWKGWLLTFLTSGIYWTPAPSALAPISRSAARLKFPALASTWAADIYWPETAKWAKPTWICRALCAFRQARHLWHAK